MKVSKTKYAVEFTEEEKKAILKIMEIPDILYDEDICSNKECEKCPFYNNFCVARVNNDARIGIFLDKLENFINGN